MTPGRAARGMGKTGGCRLLPLPGNADLLIGSYHRNDQADGLLGEVSASDSGGGGKAKMEEKEEETERADQEIGDPRDWS